MSLDRPLRKTHRAIAVLFLLTVPLAAYASFTGDPESPSPLVYAPLLPMLVLTLTGVYLLVRPWVLKARARRSREPASPP